jgi:hypothetical protein
MQINDEHLPYHRDTSFPLCSLSSFFSFYTLQNSFCHLITTLHHISFASSLNQPFASIQIATFALTCRTIPTSFIPSSTFLSVPALPLHRTQLVVPLRMLGEPRNHQTSINSTISGPFHPIILTQTPGLSQVS